MEKILSHTKEFKQLSEHKSSKELRVGRETEGTFSTSHSKLWLRHK